MKKVRKVFGVLLMIFGAALSIIITLTFAVGMDSWIKYNIVREIWVYLLLFLMGILIIWLGTYLFRGTSVRKVRKAKMVLDSTQTEEYKTFRSDPKEQFKVFCVVTFLPIAYTAFRMMVFGIDRDVIIPVLCGLLLMSVLGGLFTSCYTYRIRVEIGDFGIRFYRGAHMYASYPLNSGFHIARDTEGMQRIFTTYAISIGLEDQKKKRRVFFGFSDREFKAAWYELCSLLREAEAVKEKEQSTYMPQSFMIPKADIKAVMRRMAPQISATIWMFGMFIVALWAALIYLPNEEVFGVQSVYIGMVAVTVIAVVCFVIRMLRNKHLCDFIPEKITFGEGWLLVGDDRYYASQITQIEYTAVDYCPQIIGKLFYRYLIINTQGKTGIYLLGHKSAVQYQVYQDYAVLMLVLYRWCQKSSVSFSIIPDPCIDVKTMTKNYEDKYSYKL